MPVTYKLISTLTVSTATQAAIEFTSIPGTFDDLIIHISPRSNASAISSNLFVQFNNASTGHYDRYVGGSGSTTFSGVVISDGNRCFLGDINANTSTASTFGSVLVYISNYASSNSKSLSIDSVGENNATTAYAELIAGLFTGSAITSAKLTVGDGTPSFMQHSTAYLYGIKKS